MYDSLTWARRSAAARILAASGIRLEGPGTIGIAPAEENRVTIAVVGAGNAATALAARLALAGHSVVGASGRAPSRERVARHLPGTPLLPAEEAAKRGEVVILGVVDDLIDEVCSELADRGAVGQGQYVIHLSGSVQLEALSAAGGAGAETLAMHPLQSFPDVESGIRRLPGSAMAVTAESPRALRLGEALARDAGTVPFRLSDEAKPLYHAAAVFCSNYVVAVIAVAERLFRAAGLEEPLELLGPLARSSLESTLSIGAGALTGPATRGDVGTIRRDLEAIRKSVPEATETYVALAQVAAALSLAQGRISSAGKAEMERALHAWK